MEYTEVDIEAHWSATTIYVAGFLSRHAAARVATLLGDVSSHTQTVRLDLRAVQLIDPIAFVGVVRALASWRNHRCGRTMIQFPERSYRNVRSAYQRATVLAPAMASVGLTTAPSG